MGQPDPIGLDDASVAFNRALLGVLKTPMPKDDSDEAFNAAVLGTPGRDVGGAYQPPPGYARGAATPAGEALELGLRGIANVFAQTLAGIPRRLMGMVGVETMAEHVGVLPKREQVGMFAPGARGLGEMAFPTTAQTIENYRAALARRRTRQVPGWVAPEAARQYIEVPPAETEAGAYARELAPWAAQAGITGATYLLLRKAVRAAARAEAARIQGGVKGTMPPPPPTATQLRQLAQRAMRGDSAAKKILGRVGRGQSVSPEEAGAVLGRAPTAPGAKPVRGILQRPGAPSAAIRALQAKRETGVKLTRGETARLRRWELKAGPAPGAAAVPPAAPEPTLAPEVVPRVAPLVTAAEAGPAPGAPSALEQAKPGVEAAPVMIPTLPGGAAPGLAVPLAAGPAQEAAWALKQARGGPEQRLVARRSFEMTRDYLYNVRRHVYSENVRTQNILEGKTDDGSKPVMVQSLADPATRVKAKPLTPQQQQDLIFVIDSGLVEFFETGSYTAHVKHATAGKGNLFRKGDTLGKLQGRVTPEMVVAGRRLMDQMSALRQQLADLAGATFPQLATTPAFIEEAYVPHLYKGWKTLTKSQRERVSLALRKRNPLDLQRIYETMEAAIAASGGKLKPRFKTIGEYLDAHRKLHATATFGKMFMEELKELDDSLGTATPLVSTKPEGKGWHQTDHWFFHFYRSIPFKKGARPSVYVHPELWAYSKSIFGEPWHGIGGDILLAGMAAVNRTMKRVLVSMTPFHLRALFMSTLPSYETGALGAVFRAPEGGVPQNLFTDILASHAKLRDPAWVADAAGHGLMIGDIPSDVRRSVMDGIDQLYKSPSFKKQLIGAAGKGLTTPLRMMDWLTWEVGFKSGMVITYENATKALVGTGLPLEEAKRRAAVMANAVIGAPDWQNLGTWMRDPKFYQLMHAFLLSANWTTSTLQQGLLPFASVGGGPPPPAGAPSTPGGTSAGEWRAANAAARGEAVAWWTKYLAQLFLFSQVANRVSTKRDFKKARWTWENPDNVRRYQKSGNPYDLMRVHGGIDPKTNRTWSFQVSKQGPEFAGWFTDPARTGGQKLNPFLRIAFELSRGYQFGAPRPFPVKPGPFGKPFGRGAPARLEHVIERSQPFILRREWEPEGPVPGISPTFGLFPVATGIGVGAATHEFEAAQQELARSGDQEAEYKRFVALQEAMRASGVEAQVDAPKDKKGRPTLLSVDPDLPRGKVWRSEKFRWDGWKSTQSKLRTHFGKVLAHDGLEAAKQLMPMMGRMMVDRESMERNLASKHNIQRGRLRAGRADDVLVFHGKEVRKADIREALSWFR